MKQLRILIIALTILGTSLNSAPTSAAVGAIFSPVLVTAGLYTMAGGTVQFFGCIYLCKSNAAWPLIGLMAVGLGIVILDGEQGVAYDELSEKEGASLGLTGIETSKYNQEIDEINALVAHVDRELSLLSKPSNEDSVAIWKSIKDAISPEAFSALLKVTASGYENSKRK